MGDPKDDPTAHARAAADAELARQDKVAADQLALSESNLRTMAAELGQEGYGDASVGLTRAARQQQAQAALYSKQADHLQEASKEWEDAAGSLEAQARFTGQALVQAAEHRRAQGALEHPPVDDADQTNRELAEVGTAAHMWGHVADAAMMSDWAEQKTEKAIEAEKQALAIHPELDDGVAPEAPASE